eukprot:TRINITY_DN3909_c0_g2_i1.p1 TRINITY_DN3909_c0_g2~~TRINITY_DN3909_c0_g2_i1.p1  ORF type:complete len:669 (-),score=177.71 TRINITY_DN3909_c0_g2_i1:125-2131(-)
MSLVNETNNDWRYRKITLFGAARGIVSQLNHGQDLTHISMPAVFLYPFSILELGALRLMNKIHYVYDLNQVADPFERMKGVSRWFVSLFEQEWQERKPYNPILGKTHKCWTEHEKYGRTDIILEQIMHHPPITAFGINTPKHQVKVEGNLEFAVEFGGNSLNLTSRGYARLTLEKFGEEYIFSRLWPDMLVTNVIIGTRKHLWQNDVHLSCAQSGYSAQFTFYEEAEGYWGEIFNFVEGVIGKNIGDEDEEEIQFIITGKLGDVVKIHPYDDPDQTEVFLEGKKLTTTQLQYPKPEDQDEMESLKIWSEVNKYVVEDDMYSADAAKLQVEEAQRKKRAERKTTGLNYRPVYFVHDSALNGWVLAPPPKFSVTCGAVCDANHRALISIPETATVQEAAEILHGNNILCAPVLNNIDLPLGLVDVLDLLSYIVGISGFFEDISKSPETISQNKLQYSTSPVTSLISASGVNLTWKLERNSPLDLALETFTSGAHRILVGDPKNLSILTQSHVLKYLWQMVNEGDNAQQFPKLSKTLKQLSLGSVAVLLDRPISITTNMTAIEGFRLLYVSKIHGLAIVTEDQKLVGNLSASHLACLTANRLEDLLLPVLEFKQAIGKADEPLVTCHDNASLKEAMELLVNNHVHRLYIVDEGNRPTGVVSISDVLAQFRD